MGRNNQQRRAAKARARSRRHASAEGSAHPPAFFRAGSDHVGSFGPMPQPSLREQVAEWLGVAFDALDASDGPGADAASAQIATLSALPGGRRVVTQVLTETLTAGVEHSWQLGWQPADLHRLVGRQLDAEAQLVVADAVASQLSRYPQSTIASRWSGQLREIGAGVWWSRDTDAVSARALTVDGGLRSLVPSAVRVAALLTRLPRLERHDPLPGTTPAPQRPDGPRVDDRVLARVRALLAKAESTTFEAEAETFTAGAQALMARHSIDAAMLDAVGEGTAGGPQGRRIGIDRPYEAPKVLLLDVVARANRCRSIWSKSLGFVTIVGFAPDLEASETIFTSLLVQAGHAMQAQGSRTTRFGQSRTRAFRQSFLMAYANRIGERLIEVTDEETEAAVTGSADSLASGRELVRVLDQRAAAVVDAMATMFPEMVEHGVGSANDPEGWQAGRRAADQASLRGAGGRELTG